MRGTRARWRLAAFSWLALSATAVAQQTIVVQGDHLAFQRAVGIARHGDVLLVRAGAYSGFASTDQGITILCDPGVTLEGDGPRGSGFVVASLPAGQVFRMRGGSFSGFPQFVDPALVLDCAGHVQFEGAGFSSGPTIRRSASVALNGCGGARCTIEDSTVSLAATRLGGILSADPAVGAGLVVRRSTVDVSGGRFVGADGQLFFGPTAGMSIASGSVTMSGPPGTEVVGGGIGGTLPSAPAVILAGGRFDHDPRVGLVSGAPQPIVGPGTVTRRPIPAVEARGVSRGQSFMATAWGEPGNRLHVLVALPTPPVPSPFGTIWVPADGLVLDSGIVPASGSRTTSLTLPPVGVGLPLVLQPLTTLATGRLAFGPPTFVILD